MTTENGITNEVKAAVEEIVRREMGPFGLRTIKVTAAEDHDGDPILRIEADYAPGGRPIDTKVVAGLATKLRNRLWAMGEGRFPHVRHHFSEQQKVAG